VRPPGPSRRPPEAPGPAYGGLVAGGRAGSTCCP